jgi:hypothetical protein
MTNNCELNEGADVEFSRATDSSPDQQELRERYEEQQRRLHCPSCGEEPFVG